MFQTEPILFLQGISSGTFHVLMLVVNELGRPAPAMLLAFLLVSLDAGRGFLLIQVLAITAILTETLKRAIALPRPYVVDSNVRILDGPGGNSTPFSGMGADSFFAPLPEPVVDYHRALADPHWGFPSGHVSSSIALGLALWLIYQRQWLLIATGFFTVAVAAARLYLGKHFLADVLGGALLGASVSLLAWRAARHCSPRPGAAPACMPSGRLEYLRIAWLVVVPGVLMILPAGETRWFAALFGVNLGYLATRKLRMTQRNAGIMVRMMHTGVALIVLAALATVAWYSGALRADAGIRADAALVGTLCFVAIAAPPRIAERLVACFPGLQQ